MEWPIHSKSLDFSELPVYPPGGFAQIVGKSPYFLFKQHRFCAGHIHLYAMPT
jgi:hypothetical protein